jgi:hypothetical protein
VVEVITAVITNNISKVLHLPILRRITMLLLPTAIRIGILSSLEIITSEQTTLVLSAGSMVITRILAHIWSELGNSGPTMPIVKGKRFLSRHPTLHHLNINLWCCKTPFQTRV